MGPFAACSQQELCAVQEENQTHHRAIEFSKEKEAEGNVGISWGKSRKV
jgi:hypothetical protein